MNCIECELPNRKLWTLFGEHRKPKLADVESGNYIFLQRCLPCNALWCLSPYEPYASFAFLVWWPHDEVKWHSMHALDDGRTLLAWHALKIAQNYRNLPSNELDQIERYRQRSYGYNPIDNPGKFHAAELLASTMYTESE